MRSHGSFSPFGGPSLLLSGETVAQGSGTFRQFCRFELRSEGFGRYNEVDLVPNLSLPSPLEVPGFELFILTRSQIPSPGLFRFLVFPVLAGRLFIYTLATRLFFREFSMRGCSCSVQRFFTSSHSRFYCELGAVSFRPLEMIGNV